MPQGHLLNFLSNRPDIAKCNKAIALAAASHGYLAVAPEAWGDGAHVCAEAPNNLFPSSVSSFFGVWVMEV